MRIASLLVPTVVATGLATAAVGAEPAPLSAAAMDHVTAGAFAAGTTAAAGAISNFIAASFTDTDSVVVTDDDPAPGSLQGSAGVTGGVAASWTAGGGEPRSADVVNAAGGDGFEVLRLTVGGTSQSPITTMEAETVFVMTATRDPYLLRP